MSGSGPDRGLIRLAVPGDEPQIADTVTTAFGAAEGPVVARLVKALQASPGWGPGLSFVAVHPAGQVIGYVLATVNLLDAPRRLVDVLVLSPLAVHPAHQHRGVGSRLVRHALAVLQDQPEPLVFLEGSPAYYPRLGLQPAGKKAFCRPFLPIPEPAFM